MKFIVFQHVPHEHPGLITTFARENNITLDIIELWQSSYHIPPFSGYDALIIMGGPMGVYEDEEKYPSKNNEVKIIQQAVGQMPILGFCLGSQLLAHALGANVHPIFDGFSSPIKVLQWHGDAFDLPKGARLLASSPLCNNQAFRYNNTYGLLFHFEFTPEMVAKQIKIDRTSIQTDHTLNEKVLMNEAKINSSLMEKQSKTLLANFISVVKS